jgi:lipopolysaccharide transport system permease protein
MEELIISAEAEEKNYWRDLWSYRELLYFLAWRDLLVRYKQTTVGVAWAVIRPVLQIIIFTFLFQRVAKMTSPIPYALLVTGGALPWNLFASTFAAAGDSLIAGSSLISKIYFPRLLVPASTLVVALVDFAISLLILVVLMVWFQYLPDWRILMLPFFIILTLTASLGAGLWLAALTVKYRDFRFISPFIVQIGFFVSPVGFDSSKLTIPWQRLLYSLNPMVGAIDGYRWALFRGTTPFYWPGLLLSVAVSVFLLITAIIYFRKTEKSFVDMI